MTPIHAAAAVASITCLTAVLLLRRQNRYLQEFAQAGAVSAGSAKSLPELQLIDNRVFRFLVRNGVIQSAETERWFLDPTQADSFRLRRRRRSIQLVTGAVSIVAAIWIWVTVA